MLLKLGMKHQGDELYKVYINHFDGKISKCHLKETKLKGNRQMDLIFMILKTFGPQGLAIYKFVYYHNIQRSSSLQPLGQTSCEASFGKGNESINGPGHMTNMVAMAINRKNL